MGPLMTTPQTSSEDPLSVGPHLRVVEHATFAQCLNCFRQVGLHTGRGKFNYHYLKGQDCRPFMKKKAARATAISSALSSDDQDPPACGKNCCLPQLQIASWGDCCREEK
eukprot:5818946-Amphidinium_carterae.1